MSIPVYGREPGELKHLSNWRRKKKRDSVSSGERTGSGPNRGGLLSGYIGMEPVVVFYGSDVKMLESMTAEGDSPVWEACCDQGIPE